jgi:hypothetical protein
VASKIANLCKLYYHSNELAFHDVKNVDFGIEFNAAVNKIKLKAEDLNTVFRTLKKMTLEQWGCTLKPSK